MTLIPPRIAAKLDASPHVVDNWRSGWKWWSVRLGVLSTLFGFIMAIVEYEAIASPLFGFIPRWLIWPFVSLVAIGAILLRFVKQDKPIDPS